MKKVLKKIRAQNPHIYRLLINTLSVITRFINFKKRIYGNNNKLLMTGAIVRKTSCYIKGNNNTIHFSPECYLKNCTIYILGNNHTLKLGERSKLYHTELWFEDRDNTIQIGMHTSINGAHIAITEHNHTIEIGDNCLFSKEIDIRNGDSHSIIDLKTNKRINFAGNIKIGNHVWLGKYVKILKGTVIGDNSIIGINSLVISKINKNSLGVGIPAKVVKTDINWKHQRIY